ncbi:Myb-like domain [Macleaya cordata]|uniref:Myb-like domain n=1 Tax=Macleaya cordata TaxID=56857 RepID=A0A200R998_MACCD|nr:Myb-like domain [Macleaya cordata]
MEETQQAVDPQNFQTPKKEELGLESKRKTSSSSRVVGSRFTRSRIAPDWTAQEMLILVREIAAIDAAFLRALPSIQKWKMISDNCAASGVVRSSDQCHRKWESLLVEFKKIKDWESQPGVASYWSLENERKMELGLPSFFDEELFRSVCDNLNLKAQGDRSGTEPDSESEAEVEMLNAVVESGPKRQKGARSRERGKIGRPKSKIIEMAVKTRGDIELIHTILRGDHNENKDIALNELRNPGMLQMELARRQGNDLIEALGSLVEKLDQLSDIVEERG